MGFTQCGVSFGVLCKSFPCPLTKVNIQGKLAAWERRKSFTLLNTNLK